MLRKKLKVLMASSEVAPLAKTGGLADVVGSLPPALKKNNCDVRIIIPKYGLIDEKKFKLKQKAETEVITNGKKAKIKIWETKLPGKNVIIYLIDYKKHFGKKEIYHGNSSERFLFFSLAVLQSLPAIKFKPDVIHCHDFHSAMITDLIKASDDEEIKNIKTVYTIHNLNYQGKSEVEVLSTGNLNKDSLKSLTRDAQDNDINFMVQGIINSDAVNTVSPTYSREITTSVYGAGLEKVTKQNKKKLTGILNGIDVDFFNPQKDKFIYKKYSVKNLANKAQNKLSLQKELGLPVDKDVALVGFVSRLVWQKGLELIDEDLIKNSNCQFVFLGTGQKEYEQQLKKLAKKYPEKVSACIMFDVGLAQKIYAGSDIFLIPSRFEPCGLTQMISMRYGAVPVVRNTGGLADTVDSKVGFKFGDFEAPLLAKALQKALKIYYNDKKKWERMVREGMSRDFSWNKSAQDYLDLYRKVL